MDRFVNDQNLERLRKLANVSTTEAERKILFGLLAEEKTEFIELQKARIAVLNLRASALFSAVSPTSGV